MKKPAYILIGLMMLFVNNYSTNAQAGASVVTDPASYAYLSQSVENGAEAASQLGKAAKLLQDAKDVYDKVNSKIQTAAKLGQIISNTDYLIQSTKGSYNDLEGSGVFTTAELGYIMSSFSFIINQAKYDMQLASEISQDNMFKMNDNERMTWLEKLGNQSSKHSNDAYILEAKYDRLKEKKQLVQTFGGNIY
jgi:hypothetical protein